MLACVLAFLMSLRRHVLYHSRGHRRCERAEAFAWRVPGALAPSLSKSSAAN